MLKVDKKTTEWLASVPEEEYLRVVYFGKLQIPPSIRDGTERGTSTIYKA